LNEAHPEVEQASAFPVPQGQHSVEALSRGIMVVKYYAPRETDEQTPHAPGGQE